MLPATGAEKKSRWHTREMPQAPVQDLGVPLVSPAQAPQPPKTKSPGETRLPYIHAGSERDEALPELQPIDDSSTIQPPAIPGGNKNSNPAHPQNQAGKEWILEEKLPEQPIRHLRPAAPPLLKPGRLDVPVFDIWWISTYASWMSHFSGRQALPAAEKDLPDTTIIKDSPTPQPRKLLVHSTDNATQIDLAWKDAFLQNEWLARKRSTERDYFQRDLPLNFYKTYQQQEGLEPLPVEDEGVPQLDEPSARPAVEAPKIKEPDFLPAVILLKGDKEEQAMLQERMKALNLQREKERELLKAIDKALQDISQGALK